MKLWNTIAAAAAGMALLSGCASDGSAASANEATDQADQMVAVYNATLDQATGNAEVIGVAMHSDRCAACQTLGPKVTEAMAELNDDRVRLLKADYTDRDNPAAAATLANFGLSDLAEMNKGKTGVMYLVDAQTGEVLGRVGGPMTVDEIREQLASALETATS
ncbi:MAG: hypothetical protein AAF138_04880 [Planctomycetota bacterium]